MSKFILSLLLCCSLTALAQVEETQVDFNLSPSVLTSGKIQVAFEWLDAAQFSQRQMRVMDQPAIQNMHPENLKMVASKVALISQQSFDELTYEILNQAAFIQDMLGALAITQISSDTWYLTNRVKAYKLPFRLGYELQAREINAAKMNPALVQYLRKEAAGFKGSGRERFVSLDMTKFTQLIYRNYSIIYMKELSNQKLLIVSGVIAGINLNRANSYFNYPPFSRTETKMIGNMREQVLQMAQKIQFTN